MLEHLHRSWKINVNALSIDMKFMYVFFKFSTLEVKSISDA